MDIIHFATLVLCASAYIKPIFLLSTDGNSI